MQVNYLDKDTAKDYVYGQGAYAAQRCGLAAIVDYTDSVSVERMRHIKEQIVDPFFEQPTGTLVAALGINNEQLKKWMVNLDEFTGCDPITVDPGQPNRNDKIFVPTYLRFKTKLGSWLLKDSLIEAGFMRTEVGELIHALLTDASKQVQLVARDKLSRKPNAKRGWLSLGRTIVSLVPAGASCDAHAAGNC